VKSVLEEVDGQHPPADCRPGLAEVISGTRIGAGLTEAVNAHDKRFPGYQDIFLLSDGDDPGDDKEWLQGSTKARENKIPVHTVGIGNPAVTATMILGSELVSTRLQEEPLKQIAAETRGQYLLAGTQPPQLGEFFRNQIEPLPARDVSDDSVPLPRERYPWFLAPSLVLFLIGWLRGR
jgi:Ca-activated chloride channel family protein